MLVLLVVTTEPAHALPHPARAPRTQDAAASKSTGNRGGRSKQSEQAGQPFPKPRILWRLPP